MRVVVAALFLSLTACVNAVDPGQPPPPPQGPQTQASAPPADHGTDDGSAAANPTDGTDPDGAHPQQPAPDDAGPPAADDPDGDGVVSDGDPGIPADAQAACAVASDCGAATDTERPGFACVDDTCQCDPGGAGPSQCEADGGTWSAFECACFLGTATPMPSAVPQTPTEAEDDVCWWIWRDTYCDPDCWVDTSYYDYVCYGPDDCGYEYVDDGYYEDGDCYGRWIVRCTDGNEYWM